MADVKWIAVAVNMFDDEKIALIEAMPDADAIIVIWLKMLTLAGKLNNGGVLMMGGILSLTGAFTSSFQDYLPEGTEGRFQGVRMCFMVLIPMIIGPIISLLIGLDAMGMNGENFVPPYAMFLAAALVALLAAIPIWLVRKNSK